MPASFYISAGHGLSTTLTQVYKRFLFEFFDCFIALFYIAFWEVSGGIVQRVCIVVEDKRQNLILTGGSGVAGYFAYVNLLHRCKTVRLLDIRFPQYVCVPKCHAFSAGSSQTARGVHIAVYGRFSAAGVDGKRHTGLFVGTIVSCPMDFAAAKILRSPAWAYLNPFAPDLFAKVR